ncbi:MAG: hypothetical protein AAF191_09230 [Verrucomicrobiota bacterium]
MADLLTLDLPEISPLNAPLTHEVPSLHLAHQHSLILATATSSDLWEKRRNQMNPQRFVW